MILADEYLDRLPAEMPARSSPRCGPTRKRPACRRSAPARASPGEITTDKLNGNVATFCRIGNNANLVSEWLPALDGVVGKLEQGARDADIGCGHGHLSVEEWRRPTRNRNCFGYDVHESSIEEARRIALAEGISDRVTFEVADAASFAACDLDMICKLRLPS